jgi:hypothetical protein
LGRELTAAHPTDAPQATSTREFELRAAPGTIQQFDRRLLDVRAYNFNGGTFFVAATRNEGAP